MSQPPASAQSAQSSNATTGPNSLSAAEALAASLPTNPDGTSLQLGGLDSIQILTLLRHLPGVVNKLTEQGQLKEAAAETLSNLSQSGNAATSATAGGPPPGNSNLFPPTGYTVHMQDPGPSSHPRGPPNLGQPQGDGQPLGPGAVPPPVGAPGPTRGPRGKSATMTQDEWSRQRKDNHKEVERRRRGNINEGINELGRIVPNGNGEKAKGAILSRAVQYIHHLKENEARNIEKWTLEKLLMDQAMGDLQAQLEEMRRMWEEERKGRQRAERELEVLRGLSGQSAGAVNTLRSESNSGSERGESPAEGAARRRAREEEGKETEEDRDGKRMRVD